MNSCYSIREKLQQLLPSPICSFGIIFFIRFNEIKLPNVYAFMKCLELNGHLGIMHWVLTTDQMLTSIYNYCYAYCIGF